MAYFHLTTDVVPDSLRLDQVFGVVTYTKKTMVDKEADTCTNHEGDLYEALEQRAYRLSEGKANLLYGIRIAIATAQVEERLYLFTAITATVGSARVCKLSL